MHHHAVPTEAFAALGALIQPHADADSHVFKDGAELLAPHFRIMP